MEGGPHDCFELLYLPQESTIGNLSMTEIDDKNNPEQKTVTIDAAIGEGEVYEPAAPPKTSSRS